MADEKIEAQGFIDIEVVNTKTKTTRHYKNTITQAGKMLILDKSAARLLLSGADSFGYMAQIGRITKLLGVGTGAAANPYGAGRDARADSMLTCALLNMGPDGASWTEQTNSVNLFGDNLDDTSKVVGYANNNPTPAGSKEGQIDYCLGVYQVDGKTVAERWKFAEGVASGTINIVAMMPSDSVQTNHGQGFQVSKCIDKCHIQSPNFGSLSTGFLPPNISGYTTSEEILLNFIMDGISQWKYNTVTGDMAEVPIGSPFFVPEQADRGVFDMMVDGDFLYVLTPYSTAMPLTASTFATVTIYQISTGMTEVKKFNLSRKVSGESKTGFKFFKLGDNLYVSGWSSNQIATLDTWSKFWKLNKGSAGYATTATVQVDYSTLGITMPAGIDMTHAGLATTPNGKMWLLVSCEPSYADTAQKAEDNGFINIAYEANQTATDLQTAKALTFSGNMLFGLTPNTYFDGVNVLKIGVSFYSILASDILGTIADNTDMAGQIVNTSGTAKVDYQKAGCFISKAGWSGNILSFVYLATPIEKVENDILYVTYGYKIV